MIKDITSAARIGGGDVEANPRLRLAIQNAKSANMPADNIERAIKKATGQMEGVRYEEIIYEGYTPGGAALLLEVVTDNRNRTAGEIRHHFTKHSGSLGSTGCVAWMFDKKGVITVAQDAADEDQLMEVVLDAGADDLVSDEDGHRVTTSPDAFEAVRRAIEAAGIATTSAELTRIPSTTKRLVGPDVAQAVRLLELLDDHDDIANLFSNADFDDDVATDL